MKSPITGIHHVTAIASDPQANLDFYAGVLGLRLVKRTVNFDDPSAYHLYYGDESGSPGSIVTFFYWPGLAARGRIGSGQSTALSFSVAPDSLDFWRERLEAHQVEIQQLRRSDEDTLQFADPDHIPVEIVAVANDHRTGWSGAGIPEEHTIRGLHTAELTLSSDHATQELLVGEMGFRVVRKDEVRTRLEAGPGGSGSYVDLVVDPRVRRGTGGAGAIHHVAWSVPGDSQELTMLKRLQSAGYPTSGVRDRDYFHSIYYREPGGVLFEIATENPGFDVDEPLDQLGQTLKLPRQFAHARTEIEHSLPTLNFPTQAA